MSPSTNKRSAEFAEERWQIEVKRFNRRQTALGIGIAACILASYPAASAGLKILAGLCAVGALAGAAAVIYLRVRNYRLFIEIRMTGGMTREQALSEWTQRFGG